MNGRCEAAGNRRFQGAEAMAAARAANLVVFPRFATAAAGCTSPRQTTSSASP